MKLWRTKVNHVDETTVDYAALTEAILDGRAKRPFFMSKLDRGLEKWRSANKDEYERIKTQSMARRGVAPVVGEDAWAGAGARGFRPSSLGGGLGSGLVRIVTAPREFMMATNWASGWNPNSVGSPSPMIGPPIGRNLLDGKDLGFDCINWLQQGLLSTPSAFIMSVPGLGKSSLVRQVLVGHMAQNHAVIVPNDLKGEHVAVVAAHGGQVITIGHGLDQINPLDAGALGSIVPKLQAAIDEVDGDDQKARQRVLELDKHLRRAKKEVAAAQRRMVETLVAIARQGRMADYESSIVAVALDELYTRPDPETGESRWVRPPLIDHLIDQIAAGSDELRKVTVTSETAYDGAVQGLLRSLYALQRGVTGEIFSGQTTTKIDVDAPGVVIDVSSLDDNDETVKSAVMMSCWSSAAGAVTASKILADAGLRKKRIFAYTLDELWGTLAGAPDLTKHVDGLMRLLRTIGAAVYLITHGSKDLETLPTEADRNRAMGFIDRAGAVICGGLPADELDLLRGKLPFTRREIAEITAWSKGVAPKRVRDAGAPVPPGRGCFMIKASKSSSPGIPFRTYISPLEDEHDLHDTNVAFREEWERIAGADREVASV